MSATTGRPHLLTLQQASAEYGPPYTSLRDLVLRGELPSVRFATSRRIWVRRVDLERLIERSTERQVGPQEFKRGGAFEKRQGDSY